MFDERLLLLRLMSAEVRRFSIDAIELHRTRDREIGRIPQVNEGSRGSLGPGVRLKTPESRFFSPLDLERESNPFRVAYILSLGSSPTPQAATRNVISRAGFIEPADSRNYFSRVFVVSPKDNASGK